MTLATCLLEPLRRPVSEMKFMSEDLSPEASVGLDTGWIMETVCMWQRKAFHNGKAVKYRCGIFLRILTIKERYFSKTQKIVTYRII